MMMMKPRVIGCVFCCLFFYECFGSVQMQSIMLVCRWQRWTPGHTHAHVYSALWVTCSFPYLLTTQHRNHNPWQHVHLHFLPRVRLLYFFPFFFFFKICILFQLDHPKLFCFEEVSFSSINFSEHWWPNQTFLVIVVVCPHLGCQHSSQWTPSKTRQQPPTFGICVLDGLV